MAETKEAASPYAGVQRVVVIHSTTSKPCEHCRQHPGSLRQEDDYLENGINHYIREHGYRLLHVGTESTRDGGGTWHATIAVLGVADAPPIMPEPGPLDLGARKREE